MSVVKEADCLCVRTECVYLYSWYWRFSLKALALNPHLLQANRRHLLKRKHLPRSRAQ